MFLTTILRHSEKYWSIIIAIYDDFIIINYRKMDRERGAYICNYDGNLIKYLKLEERFIHKVNY